VQSASNPPGARPPRQHHYQLHLKWTGNTGTGTSSYRAYRRDHEITCAGKSLIAGSADPKFRGDQTRWNPEELLVASLAACHELWYLHLCADAGIIVVAYEDAPEGFMDETADGAGQFTRVVLRPRVLLRAGSDRDRALALHEKAHALCFIARSVNFPVENQPDVTLET
jgi:organic hydroperoxide reductase OsmC/OhrA